MRLLLTLNPPLREKRPRYANGPLLICSIFKYIKHEAIVGNKISRYWIELIKFLGSNLALTHYRSNKTFSRLPTLRYVHLRM